MTTAAFVRGPKGGSTEGVSRRGCQTTSHSTLSAKSPSDQTSPPASAGSLLVMNHNSVLKAFVLTVGLAIPNAALANPDLADLIDQAKANQNAAKANLTTSVINGKGTITYNGRKVWQGPVKEDLKAFSKATSTSENGQQKSTEYAAVWDGKKLVWENQAGAGAALEPERQEQERKLEELKRQLRN